jgi:hypothetical protein
MRGLARRAACLVVAASSFGLAGTGSAPAAEKTASGAYSLSLSSPEKLILQGVEARAATHLGRKAVRLTEAAPPSSVSPSTGEAIALLPEPRFQDGTIDIDVAGRPLPGAPEGARGFVGVAFRAAADASAFECMYLRPTNGRADDQLRRNHSTQYISHPEYGFARFRKEAPGVYESYVDLETGAWTHVRIEIAGTRGLLFVNGSPQPVLVVNDLKHGVSAGQVGLWIGSGTEAFFSTIRIRIDR